MPTTEQLKSRLLKHSIPVTESGCWVWLGSSTQAGYGVMWNGEHNTSAHRIAHEVFIGPIEDGHTVDHLCRVRCCVNPDHLESVPHSVNLQRGETLNAKEVRVTHCPSGHAYTDVNTNRWGGMRRCRVCDREKHREKRLLRQILSIKETEA